MKRLGYLRILIILLVLFVMIFQGCATPPEDQQSTVSKDDLSIVNEYLKAAGEREISLAAAEDMNDSINENTKTHEIKSDWQLLVDYISNEKSDQPVVMTYSIEFNNDTFSVQMDKIWENIAR